MANRIHSKGDYRYEERNAGVAGLYPGMLVMVNSDGEVVVHDTEGGRAEKMFAMEDALQGKVVGDVFTLANPVPCIIPSQGGEVNVLIRALENISIGDELISAGDGTLIAVGSADSLTTIEEVLAIAMEEIDLSDSTDENTLARVRVK